MPTTVARSLAAANTVDLGLWHVREANYPRQITCCLAGTIHSVRQRQATFGYTFAQRDCRPTQQCLSPSRQIMAHFRSYRMSAKTPAIDDRNGQLENEYR